MSWPGGKPGSASRRSELQAPWTLSASCWQDPEKTAACVWPAAALLARLTPEAAVAAIPLPSLTQVLLELRAGSGPVTHCWQPTQTAEWRLLLRLATSPLDSLPALVEAGAVETVLELCHAWKLGHEKLESNELAWQDLRLLAEQFPRAVPLAFFRWRHATSQLYSVWGAWPTPYERQRLRLPLFALLTAAVDDRLLSAVPDLEPVRLAARVLMETYTVLSEEDNASNACIGRRVLALCETYKAQRRRAALT